MATTSSLDVRNSPLPSFSLQKPSQSRFALIQKTDWQALFVLVVACAVGLNAYVTFLQMPEHLWPRAIHDRNTHYSLGLSMALDLRQGDIVQFLHDFDGSRVWGPFHGMCVAATQILTGPDYRLAVLPSLFGWVAAVFFGFLLARRIAGVGGTVAGLFAAIMILGSPAHHAFATDIMLESMGAALSLAALYCYVVAVQDEKVWAGRVLGLALTILFIYKYNYWVLALAAIFLAELGRQFNSLLPWANRNLAGFDWRKFIIQQIKAPLNYLIVGLTAAAVYIGLTGGGIVEVGGFKISLTSPHNLLHVAYILAFVRLLRWWFSSGRSLLQTTPPEVRQVTVWHLWPVAIWFLLPKRLSYFIWFLSPANKDRGKLDFMGGFPYYAECIPTDYHIALWATLLVLFLIGVAILTCRSFKKGGTVMLWFILLAMVLTIQHPNRKSRYLHSWIAGTWVVAGVGLAHLLYGRGTQRLGSARPWLAGTALASLAMVHMPTILSAAQSPDGGPVPDAPSTLIMPEQYLPSLETSNRPIIMSNLPIKALVKWTYLTRFPHRRPPEIDIKDFGEEPSQDTSIFENWLKKTRCDVLIYIHIPLGSKFYAFAENSNHDQLRKLIAEQTVFLKENEWHLQDENVTITLYRRKNAS